MDKRQLFLADKAYGKIRLTRKGMELYGKRFALSGVDISTIKTMTELEAAVDAMFKREMEELAHESKGQNPEYDAVMKGLPGWD
ncbi:MAG: hypothetical protein GY849_08630 [Deltaproteobacteria bacterium]|nr:hypothetical protein [Deltaproteobacteria bacterium]